GEAMNDINLVEHSRVLLAHLYAKRSAIGHAIASLEVLVGEHPDLLRGLPPPQVVLELDDRTAASAVTTQFEREDEEREKLRARRSAEAKEATVVAEPPPPPPAPKKPAGPPPEPSPAART